MNADSLDLRVIDLAIDRIAKDFDRLSCYALWAASEEILGARVHRYGNQYRMFVQSKTGELPGWWNVPAAGPKPRIAALRAFRQACIDAAKKGSGK